MGLAKRIIPCLDVDAGRVVKGIQFVDIRDAGDPVEVARRYDEQGADELTFLDITASSDQRETMVHVVEQVAGDFEQPAQKQPRHEREAGPREELPARREVRQGEQSAQGHARGKEPQFLQSAHAVGSHKLIGQEASH